MRARRGGRRPVAQAPLGLVGSVALYSYLVAVAGIFFVWEPPVLVILPFLIPIGVGSVIGGRAAARRRGITERPFTSGSDAIFYGIAGGVGGGIFAALASTDPIRWYGLYLLILMIIFDLLDRVRWFRWTRDQARPPTG